MKLCNFQPYYLNPKQVKALQEYVEKNLKSGFIIKSQSLIGYLVLFVLKKGDGKLYIVINY